MDFGSPALLVMTAALAGATLGVAAVRLVRQPAAPTSPAAAERQRARRMRELGWEFDETRSGDTLFALRGESEGVMWKIRCRADATHSETPKTLVWATPSVQGSATELRLIGRARYERGKAHLDPVIEKLSSTILNPRDIALAQARAEFVERTLPADVGSAAFRERFVVLARNRRLALALMDEKVQRSLMDWDHAGVRPEHVLSVWLDWQGLRIDLDAPWVDIRNLEHLVALGLVLAAGYRRHAATPGVTRWMGTSTMPERVA